MRPADTSPEVWKIYVEALGRMAPGEKIARSLELTKTVQSLAEAGLRRRHPEATDRQILLMRVRRELGDELFHKVFGNELPREMYEG